jgi:hypothetical protein
MIMGAIFNPPKPPPPPAPDPELAKQAAEVKERATLERKKEVTQKTERQYQWGKGFRGQRSLLQGDFTGFSVAKFFSSKK